MVLANIFGPDLLIVVVVIAVVIFGGAAIPKLARNLGSAKTEFEKGLKTSGDPPEGDASTDAEAAKGESTTDKPST